MKCCIVIMDGAAGRPLPRRGNRTTLELARTPVLDALTRQGKLGLTRTVPPGMEPGSAIACMSVLGYDPRVYYGGRAAIEARSLGIPIAGDEQVFRCNLVAVKDGQMWSYSSGHITSGESHRLIAALNEKLGNDRTRFFPGVGYRHILKLKGCEETLQAVCTPPHDIPGQPLAGFVPKGPGSGVLLDLMHRSEAVLKDHPVNLERIRRGEIPATTIWLFWGCGRVPEMPPFHQVFGLKAAMTSGVDLLKGLGLMSGMDLLQIEGVTDNIDNDYAAQAEGALKALHGYGVVIAHIEAPDEAGHAGSVDDKIGAIEMIDREVLARIREWRGEPLRLLIMPDHLTPIDIQTHTDEPVPFLMWGPGIPGNGATRFTEAEAARTGFFVENAYNILHSLLQGG